VTPLEAAIQTGLPCFPCTEQKSPAIPGPGGYKHATDDAAALRALWRRHPGPLVGVRTGEASGLSVLDIDGPRHPEAKARFAAHRARLPETRVHLTPSSGLHFIFRHAWGVRNTQSRLAVGIDTRGEGGFVPKIVPGDIAVTRRANPDGILPTVINNKAAEICSPQLQPNGRDRAPTPDLPSGTPMLLNQHGAYKINVQLPRIAGALRLDRAVSAMTTSAAIRGGALIT
jgi:hypothetical protein